MNLDRTGAQDPSKYDMMAVVMHEVDEVLGTVSGLALLSNPTTADLYRFNAAHGRTYSRTSDDAYFSIDGLTNLVRYNNVSTCNVSGGDCGDFHSGSGTTRVQDAFATPGAQPNLAEELRLLDVVGYTAITSNPEPGTISLFILGFAGLAGFRLRRVRK